MRPIVRHEPVRLSLSHASQGVALPRNEFARLQQAIQDDWGRAATRPMSVLKDVAAEPRELPNGVNGKRKLTSSRQGGF
jgi:hypothetical protein